MKPTRVIIVGANAAGLSAASQIKRQKPEWEVIVFEKGPYISYGSCGIPYYIEGLVPRLENLMTLSPEKAVNERNIDLRLNHNVTAINRAEKNISFKHKNIIEICPYDYLVIATGASPREEGIKYRGSERIFTVNNLRDAQRLKGFIDTYSPGKGAVIGGGYIAIEMIEALRSLGLDITMFHRRSSLTRAFDEDISDRILKEMEIHGVELALNQPVSQITGNSDQVVIQSKKNDYSYDFVVVAVGVTPNNHLAQAAGLATGEKGAIKVNEYMQTGDPYIYAAGDCAESYNLINKKPVYLPLALKANREGTTAGINICGGRETFPGLLGSSVTKFFDLGIARTGLTLDEAENSGYQAFRYKVKANSRAHYYPGGGQLDIILIAEKGKGRLLGAQMAGPVDSVKRIDVYAAVITAELTIEDIYRLDLAYAPPFAPVYDPIVLSGRIGRKMV